MRKTDIFNILIQGLISNNCLLFMTGGEGGGDGLLNFHTTKKNWAELGNPS